MDHRGSPLHRAFRGPKVIIQENLRTLFSTCVFPKSIITSCHSESTSVLSSLLMKLLLSTLRGIARKWTQTTVVQQLYFLGYSMLNNSIPGLQSSSLCWAKPWPVRFHSLYSKGNILLHSLHAVFSFPDIPHIINHIGTSNTWQGSML